MPTRRPTAISTLRHDSEAGGTAPMATPESAGPGRRKLAAGEDKDVEEPMATLRKEHERAERRLGAALAEQRRSSDRNDAAVGRSARLLAAVGLHAADQEVAARDAWLRWVDDDGYRGLNAGPFELLAEDSGP
jgi:hypothetical protein